MKKMPSEERLNNFLNEKMATKHINRSVQMTISKQYIVSIIGE